MYTQKFDLFLSNSHFCHSRDFSICKLFFNRWPIKGFLYKEALYNFFRAATCRNFSKEFPHIYDLSHSFYAVAPNDSKLDFSNQSFYFVLSLWDVISEEVILVKIFCKILDDFLYSGAQRFIIRFFLAQQLLGPCDCIWKIS